MEQNKRLGLMTVTGSYVLWGLLPAFWALLAQVNSVFILAQRILWSMVFMGLYMLVTRRWGEIIAAFRSRRILGKSLVCGVLITLNWGIYIYSVNSGHVLEASMGYFIEPVLVAVGGVVAFEAPPPGGRPPLLPPSAAPSLRLRAGGGGGGGRCPPSPSRRLGGGGEKHLDLTPQASLFMETVLMLPPWPCSFPGGGAPGRAVLLWCSRGRPSGCCPPAGW